MLSANNDFPGLSQLRQIGQRMSRMRQEGIQATNPALTRTSFNPGVPGLESSVQGIPEVSADQTDMQAGASPQVPQAPAPITLPEPPAMSSLRDVAPQRQRGLSSYRQAGSQAGQARRGLAL